MASTATLSAGANERATTVDLIGGPFAVIESDPLVFTSLLHGLGVTGLELDEVYSIDAAELDRLECALHCTASQPFRLTGPR